MTIEVLYNDRHVVAVNKPARCPVAKDASDDQTLLDNVRLWNAARQDEGKKGYCVPIHFLDRPVSGVILFALSSKAASRLNAEFRARSVQKVYWAVVIGTPSKHSDTLEDWLEKDPASNQVRVSQDGSPGAKRCLLSYKTLGSVGPHMTLLEVRPVTGRSHQIRVQLSHMGCPIFGDVKYGARETWDGRIALHAREISIKHPINKEKQVMRAPVPSYWHAKFRLPHDSNTTGVSHGSEHNVQTT